VPVLAKQQRKRRVGRDDYVRLHPLLLATLGFTAGAIGTLIATIIVAEFHYDDSGVAELIHAQLQQPALWVADFAPFLMAAWSYYLGRSGQNNISALSRQIEALRTQAVMLEHQARHHMTHDVLTNLPNRALLLKRLNRAIRNAKQVKERFAVLRLDVDRFKEINDALGHDHGDQLLTGIANRLLNAVADDTLVARVGGDEFVILVPNIGAVKDATEIAVSIEKTLKQPFTIDTLDVDAQVSIGIALYPDHGNRKQELLQHAEVAMYIAKHEKSKFSLYHSSYDNRSPQRVTLTAELRQAIDRNDLVLQYQPKIRLTPGATPEFEGLIRWPHPRHRTLPPQEFIPLAERTGLIKNVTQWVLTNALQQLIHWHNQGLDASVAVNISAQDLHDDELVDHIAKHLARHNIAPHRLVLEITETSIMVNEQRASDTLHELAKMGVRLSIDDFGTGYSSLSHLSELPIHEIKIDKSFVADMAGNPTHKMIVCATIDLAHNLGLEVIGEGVADERTFRQLDDLGCHSAQGFFISRPLHAQDVAVWARSTKWLSPLTHRH